MKTKTKLSPTKRTRQSKARSKDNYIDNKLFLAAIVDYKAELAKTSLKRIPVSNDLAEFFFKIANNLASKGNFINYTFKEDMVSDGVENCIQYVSNFNPAKSTNPFSYFTQIIYFAFIRRIKKEKKQMYIRYKSFINSELSDNEEILTMLQKNDSLVDYKREFVRNFENTLQKKKKIKPEEKTLESFFIGEEDEN